MTAEPTVWSPVSNSSNGWFQDTPEFALYNTNKLYNADLPYNVGIDVTATDWNALNSIATSWSEA